MGVPVVGAAGAVGRKKVTPESAWGTALGKLSSSLLKSQSLTLTSVPLGQLCGGQEILLGCLGPWLQASGSGDTSVTATNICVAICKPCP